MTTAYEEDELLRMEKRYKVTRLVGTTLGSLILVGSVLALWMFVLRRPSPAQVCGPLYRLAERTPSDTDRETLLRRVAPGALDGAEPSLEFSRTCKVYFENLDPFLDDKHRIGRCITTSWSLEAALDCFPSYYDRQEAARAVARELRRQPRPFPSRRPELPAQLEPVLEELVSISETAFAGCEALFDLERGCYVHGAGEARRELGRPIPGPLPSDDNIVSLVGECGFDAGTMLERYPQLLEEIRWFPLPVSQLTCSFLPMIKDEAAAKCTSFIGLPGKRNVGTERNGISVFGSNPRSCQPGLLRIELNRTNEDGHSVRIRALLRGSPW